MHDRVYSKITEKLEEYSKLDPSSRENYQESEISHKGCEVQCSYLRHILSRLGFNLNDRETEILSCIIYQSITESIDENIHQIIVDLYFSTLPILY